MDALIREYIMSNPRLAPYRKTIATAVAFLVSLLGFLVSIPTEWLPPQVTGAITVAVGLTGLLTYIVPNAMTKQQAEEFEGYVGRHRKAD